MSEIAAFKKALAKIPLTGSVTPDGVVFYPRGFAEDLHRLNYASGDLIFEEVE